MSHAPGKFRTLREDLAQVKSYQVDLVVTLLSEEEMKILGLNHMGAAVEAEGMTWKYVELRDKWIPWDAKHCRLSFFLYCQGQSERLISLG